MRRIIAGLLLLVIPLCGLAQYDTNTPPYLPPPVLRPSTQKDATTVAGELLREKKFDQTFERRWNADTTRELPSSSEEFLKLIQDKANKRSEMVAKLKEEINADTTAKNKELRRNYDMDRHDLLKRFLAEAVQRANETLSKKGGTLIRELLAINSGSSGDITRDIDLTLMAGDRVQEAALFDALREVVGSKEKGYGLTLIEGEHAAPTIAELEVSFHRGTLEPPTFTKHSDICSFALDYAKVLEGQLRNPEAYVGWGFDIEVKGRVTQTFKPGITRVQRFIAAGEGHPVAYQGDTAVSQREARALLNEPYERTYARSMRVMRIFCNLLQASHHVKEGVTPDPTKDSPKYADRSLEDLVAIHAEEFGGKAYKNMTPSQQSQLLQRIFGPNSSDPSTPEGQKLLAVKETLDRLPQLTDKTRTGPLNDAKGQPVDVTIESTRSIEFMKQCLIAEVPLIARAMLNPPYDPSFRALMQNNPEWRSLNQQERNAKVLAAEAKYRRALSIEAMTNLMATMWSLRTLHVEGHEAAGKNFGTELTEQICRDHHWNKDVRAILQHAAEYGEAKSIIEKGGLTLAQRREQLRRMARCRQQLRKFMDDSLAKTTLEEWAKTPPERAILIEDPKTIRQTLSADWELTRRIYADQVANMFDAADWKAMREKTAGQLAYGGSKRLAAWVWNETWQLPSVLDALNVVELYHNNASTSDIASALGISALGRAHWSLGYIIAALHAAQSGDWLVVGETATKSGLWTAAMFVPELVPFLVAYDVHQALTRMIVTDIQDKLDNAVIQKYYTGQSPDRETPAHPVLAKEFTVLAKDKTTGREVRVANHLKLFNDRFYKWTGVDFTDRSQPPARTNYVSRLIKECDDYVKLIEAEMALTEPTWITPEQAADNAAETDDRILQAQATGIASTTTPLDNEPQIQQLKLEDLKQRIQNRHLMIAALIRPHVEKEVAAALPPRENLPNIYDRIFEKTVNRFIGDFTVGLDHAALNRLAAQVMLKKHIENVAEMARLQAMSKALQERLLEDETPMSAVALQAGYNLPNDTKTELNGADPIPLLCDVQVMGAVPGNMPEIELALEFREVTPVDPSKPNLEPNDLVRHKVDVVAFHNGRELARQTVHILVRLAGLKKGVWALNRQWSESPEVNQVNGEGPMAMIVRGTAKATGSSAATESTYIAGPMHQKIFTRFKHMWTVPPGTLRPASPDGKEPGERFEMELSAEDDGSTKEWRTEKFRLSGKPPEWEPMPAGMQGGQTGQTTVRWYLAKRGPSGEILSIIQSLPAVGEAKAISRRKPSSKATVAFEPPGVPQTGDVKPEDLCLVCEVKATVNGAGATAYYAYTWSKTGIILNRTDAK